MEIESLEPDINPIQAAIETFRLHLLWRRAKRHAATEARRCAARAAKLGNRRRTIALLHDLAARSAADCCG